MNNGRSYLVYILLWLAEAVLKNKNAREHAHEHFEKNEHVHSFQNVRETAHDT